MSDILNAIKQICDEKGLSYEAVLETIESALAAAYRKDFGEKNQNIKVEFDPDSGKSKVFDVKDVVEDLPEEELLKEEEEQEETKEKKEKSKKEEKSQGGSAEGEQQEADEEERKFNPRTEIQLTDAKLIKKTAKIGDEIKTKLEVPAAYGRMAAQTAKQVIIQRLREAERDMVFSEFKDKEKEVISGVVQRREGPIVLIDLGKTVGVLPPEEQIYGERYLPGERIKIYVKEVRSTPRGPEIVLSRTSEEILKKVFYLEIPEISNGLIEIKAVAREAGSRAKVAVSTSSDKVDPIGSCVGQRGARIQTIISELGGEKVDIIEYDEEPVKYIINALSPAKISQVEIDDQGKRAVVTVVEDQLSLAIGKGGQNARLAARLTGWKIDIVAPSEEKKESQKEKSTGEQPEKGENEEDKKKKPKKTEKKKSKKAKKESEEAPEEAERAEEAEDKEKKKNDE